MTFDFNPRTREGCDILVRNNRYGHIGISIHAPVKGATDDTALMAGNGTISIHAPVKGATYSGCRDG